MIASAVTPAPIKFQIVYRIIAFAFLAWSIITCEPKKLEYIFMIILGLAETFKTMNQPDRDAL